MGLEVKQVFSPQMVSRIVPLWKIPLLLLKNRFKQKRKKVATYLLPIGATLFFWVLYLGAKQVVHDQLTQKDELELASALILAAVMFMMMLIFGNFATALQGFFGAFDIPYLLALPLKRSELLLGRGLSTIWNGSWTALLFSIPLCLGYLSGAHASLLISVNVVVALILLTLISGFIGIAAATLFVNLVPTSRIFEFFVVLLVVFILFIAALAPELGTNLNPASEQLKDLSKHLKNNPMRLLELSPPGLFSQILVGAKNSELLVAPFCYLLVWTVSIVGTTIFLFNKLFQRGWNLTFAGKPKQKILGFKTIASQTRLVDQQLLAMMTKELKMFIRDPAQAVQFLVILLLTFLYLFNLKNLRNLPFAMEEGSHWWQATLGLANVSMGGCVAAAMATRFVFPSVSLEGRAYPLLMVTPMSVSKLLYSKCLAWFWPTCLVNTVLLISGGLALQLPPLALLYTLLVSIALSLGLVGLGVGMGAIYARFDWDQSSSISSSLGALLYMIFSFVLILVTLLPAGFLFITACIPAFSEKLSFTMTVGPIAVAIVILLLVNLLVARGSLRSGVERLREAA